MTRNVSPITAIIVVLLACAIAGLAWVRLSTGPKPLTQGEIQRMRGRGGPRHASGRGGGQRGGTQKPEQPAGGSHKESTR